VFDGEPCGEIPTTKVLGVSLVVALLAVVLLSMAPAGTGDTYTEFYVLGPNGTASGYPENVTVGEPADIRIGIGNVESREVTYTLVARTSETTLATRTVRLGARAEWEESVSVTFDTPGSKRLCLELYASRTTDGEPYRKLQLLVDVRPGLAA